MKIGEVASQTGLSISTIRYYEASGLCPPVARGPDGQRSFSAKDLDWLCLLASLRATGMTMDRMRSFAELYRRGDDTLLDRKAALLRHRDSLADRQTELERCRAILDRKLAIYDDKLKDEE